MIWKKLISSRLNWKLSGRAGPETTDWIPSMIMGYGQDDRVCSYPSAEAMFAVKDPARAACVCLLVDKEEIGSVGATGMHSRFFENTVAEVIAWEHTASWVFAEHWEDPACCHPM